MNAIPPPAAAARRAAVVAILTAAFASDSAMRCLYPDDADYARCAPGLFAALGGRAFTAGVVDCDPDGLAAALWLPPGVRPDETAVSAHLEATIPPARLAALAAGFEIQGSLHPAPAHWYLPWIGVHPEAHGRGLGTRLLHRGLARADAEGMPAYLEATNRRNAALYARHGFHPIAVVDAPGYPEIIAMWRQGRSEPFAS
jgi:ribosomal protein S18 acetylase RimI-like enzyme